MEVRRDTIGFVLAARAFPGEWYGRSGALQRSDGIGAWAKMEDEPGRQLALWEIAYGR